ncbi:hypothetical protein AOQ71_40220 [Bradyrhizobium manausense]|uniref:Uncharacterized protein n=1 Tax=Bradyrhizobium manausense TaxID=989370 RepID=A0A0R3CZ65_9BRAD|nr:hypothetical protein [Bradyrhizobium manausense]KRQ00469.1 hypothetical protein AOQ71_40220 [Bradyrhizobium manausense]
MLLRNLLNKLGGFVSVKQQSCAGNTVSPAFENTAQDVASAGKTKQAALPPSSSTTFLKGLVVTWLKSRPAAPLQVNAIEPTAG